MKIALAIIAFMAMTTLLVQANESREVIMNRVKFPREYQMIGFPESDASFTFTLGLKQRNLEELERIFWAVATPGTKQYRNFMTEDEILDVITPPAEEREIVLNWLRDHGVVHIQDRRDNFKVTTTVAIAEKLFATKLYLFFNTQRNVKMVRQLGPYSLPTGIRRYVDIVSGVSDFPLNAHRLRAVPNQQLAIVPASLSAQYSIPAGSKAGNVNQGVIEFGSGEYFNPASLETFAQGVGVTISPLTSNHIINPLPPSGIEGTLDIQYIAGVAVNATNWYWTESDWLYDWATTFFAASSKPEIVSISYGWSELAQCDIDPTECQNLGIDSAKYVARVNTEFQKIGLNGVSILTASGDSGANGRTDPDCSVPQLRAAYPGVSPYVTSVGATQLNNPTTPLSNNPPVCSNGQWDCFVGGSESAVSFDVASFTSGGGFSWISARPSYQDAAVNAYLKSGVQLPPASYYNASGRAHPDVASLGTAILIYSQQEGGWALVGGTSAASPSFAGYIALVTQVVKQKTGKPLGFLNPFLYKMWADAPKTFTDITVGDNICTEDGCASSCKGFRCTKGWDPVTGLGVANVKEMLAYANSQF